MKLVRFDEIPGLEQKREYTVEFACVSTYLVSFKDVYGLTKHQIIQKAVEIANHTFHNGGSLSVERSNSDGYYAFTALGIDRTTGQVLGGAVSEKPPLKIIKSNSAE